MLVGEKRAVSDAAAPGAAGDEAARAAMHALSRELAAHHRAVRLVADFVAMLPCERTLFLSFELLTLLPDLHAAPLAAFFKGACSSTHARAPPPNLS